MAGCSTSTVFYRILRTHRAWSLASVYLRADLSRMQFIDMERWAVQLLLLASQHHPGRHTECRLGPLRPRQLSGGSSESAGRRRGRGCCPLRLKRQPWTARLCAMAPSQVAQNAI